MVNVTIKRADDAAGLAEKLDNVTHTGLNESMSSVTPVVVDGEIVELVAVLIYDF